MTKLFREPGAAKAGGYVLVISTVLIIIGLIFHPLPSEGFEEEPSVLEDTPWWGPIHIAIAAGFVLCVLGSFLMMFAGGVLTQRWTGALFWGSMAVGMIFFTGVALINGWVMHYLTDHGAPEKEPLVYDAFNRLLIAYGWLGNPLFLFGLTGVAYLEVRYRTIGLTRWWAIFGFVCIVLSWGRGIGSASGMYFLEPLIFAYIPAYVWFGHYAWRIARLADKPVTTAPANT